MASYGKISKYFAAIEAENGITIIIIDISYSNFSVNLIFLNILHSLTIFMDFAD
jgi:hypothetical protein